MLVAVDCDKGNIYHSEPDDMAEQKHQQLSCSKACMYLRVHLRGRRDALGCLCDHIEALLCQAQQRRQVLCEVPS